MLAENRTPSYSKYLLSYLRLRVSGEITYLLTADNNFLFCGLAYCKLPQSAYADSSPGEGAKAEKLRQAVLARTSHSGEPPHARRILTKSNSYYPTCI